MAGCFVIIQFPVEVFEILKGCIGTFVKANLLGKNYSFDYLLAVDGECADSDEINSLFEITH